MVDETKYVFTKVLTALCFSLHCAMVVYAQQPSPVTLPRVPEEGAWVGEKHMNLPSNGTS